MCINGNRLYLRDESIHLVGEEHQFVWNSPSNRERSTLYVVELPDHRGIKLQISDDSADGRRIVSIPDYRTALLSDLQKSYKTAPQNFADGAARVLIALEQNPILRKELGRWLPDVLN